VDPFSPPLLDHLVFGGPDLVAAVGFVAALTGVTAVAGGRHLGEGTANYLIGLGPGRYLEIIGPDPAGDPPTGPRWFGLDLLPNPRLLTWAMRTEDIDGAVASARMRGYDAGPARAMSRRTDEGDELSWRLTGDTVTATGGVLPFLIDWGSTAHPSSRPLPQLELLAVDAGHPSPERVRTSIAALGAGLQVVVGPAGLRAQLHGPLGPCLLV
jgi:Glyoxalase-like domain